MAKREKPVASAGQLLFVIFSLGCLLGLIWLIVSSWGALLREANYRELRRAALTADLPLFELNLSQLKMGDSFLDNLALSPLKVERASYQLVTRLFDIAALIRADQRESASRALIELEEWLMLNRNFQELFQSKEGHGPLVGIQGLLDQLNQESRALELAASRQREVDRQLDGLRDQYTLIRRDTCELLGFADCEQLGFEAVHYTTGVLEFFPRLDELEKSPETFFDLIELLPEQLLNAEELHQRFLALGENVVEVSRLLDSQEQLHGELLRETRSLVNSRNRLRAKLEQSALNLASESTRPNSSLAIVALYNLIAALSKA